VEEEEEEEEEEELLLLLTLCLLARLPAGGLPPVSGLVSSLSGVSSCGVASLLSVAAAPVSVLFLRLCCVVSRFMLLPAGRLALRTRAAAAPSSMAALDALPEPDVTRLVLREAQAEAEDRPLLPLPLRTVADGGTGRPQRTLRSVGDEEDDDDDAVSGVGEGEDERAMADCECE
jgi:hypothetical protein